MPDRDRQPRIPELDGLRGAAIFLVLLYHYGFLTPAAGSGVLAGVQSAFAIGWAGVDLFFVLSGFLIGGILLDSRESPRYFSTFYLRRFFRIIPLYYAWIGIYFVLTLSPLYLPFVSMGAAPEKWRTVPVYLFFVQNFTKNLHSPLGTSWLSQLWSLAVEEQFYLLMPLAVRFLPRRWLVALLFVAIFGAPIARLIVFKLSASHAAQYMLTPCRADALSMGVLLAVVWRNASWKALILDRRAVLLALTAVLGAGVLLLDYKDASPYSFGMTVYGLSIIDVFFACLLSTVLFFPDGLAGAACRWPVLREIGRVSYCMYVIHDFVNFATHQLVRHTRPDIVTPQGAATTLLAMAATYGIARLSWVFFEGPLLKRGHRYEY